MTLQSKSSSTAINTLMRVYATSFAFLQRMDVQGGFALKMDRFDHPQSSIVKMVLH